MAVSALTNEGNVISGSNLRAGLEIFRNIYMKNFVILSCKHQTKGHTKSKFVFQVRI